MLELTPNREKALVPRTALLPEDQLESLLLELGVGEDFSLSELEELLLKRRQGFPPFQYLQPDTGPPLGPPGAGDRAPGPPGDGGTRPAPGFSPLDLDVPTQSQGPNSSVAGAPSQMDPLMEILLQLSNQRQLLSLSRRRAGGTPSRSANSKLDLSPGF